jgi:signal transduction histidine kinase
MRESGMARAAPVSQAAWPAEREASAEAAQSDNGWLAEDRALVNLRRLRWVTLLGPPAFVGAVAVASYVPHEYSLLSHEAEHLLMAAVMVGAALAFSPVAFRVIGNAQRYLMRQNEALAVLHRAEIGWSSALDGLHRAALAVSSELSLEAVLQRVVDLSRELAQATYGALAVRGAGDDAKHFVSSGIAPAEAARAGAPSDGRALLAGHDVASDAPRPDGTRASASDAEERAMLRIPIRFQGRDIGALFLLGTAGRFSERDERLLRMFALQAAIAIENARLYEEVQRAAVIEERERIARDIHDGLGQLLGYINTKAQAARELVAVGRHDAAAGQVGELAAAAQELHADLREAIVGLRTAAQMRHGLIAPLREQVQRFRERSGLPVRLEAPDGTSALSWGPAVDGELLRIVQEALTNIRRHAGAQHAWVRIRQEDGHVSIAVRDDGCGFDPRQRPGGGLGLRSMAERAAAIDAHLLIDAAPGRGSCVKVLIRRPATVAEEERDARLGG